jgi:hemerythrin-like domain-containing protein
MTVESLADALEREHHEIDAGLEAFAAGSGGNEPLHNALEALRRHIYLEETMLFPSLREAGLFAPVMVMIREHGEMWHVMDRLGEAVEAGGADATTKDLLGELNGLIEAHNMKEEQILYPSADKVLNADAARELSEFLESGRMPMDWVCAGAAP